MGLVKNTEVHDIVSSPDLLFTIHLNIKNLELGRDSASPLLGNSQDVLSLMNYPLTYPLSDNS